MITLDCIQGDPDWIEARLGIPTSSAFKRVITPTGRLSKSRDRYLAELVAEWALGPVETFQGTQWTERGLEMEPEARRFLAFAEDVECSEAGLVYRDESRMIAASPDGMLSGGMPVEIKCPMPATHLMWLVGDVVPREHAIQCQGHLWVTGAPSGMFLSFHGGLSPLPPLLVHTRPDPEIQEAFDEHLPVFVKEVLEARAKLKAMGVKPIAEWRDE